MKAKQSKAYNSNYEHLVKAAFCIKAQHELMKMQRRPFTSMKYCKKRDIDFLFNTAYDFEKIIVRRPSLLNHSFFIPCNKNTLHTEKDNEDLVKKKAQN